MSVNLQIRPSLDKKAYRLKCRFVTNAFPSQREVEQGKYEAARLFVRDMAKQAFEYVDHYGFRMSGPFPPVQTMTPPTAAQRRQPSAREMLTAVKAGHRFDRTAADGGFARPVPLITEVDAWEFELSGVFVHETIMIEVPDEHEERN